MSKIYALYHATSKAATLTIGTKGFKIIDCDNYGRPMAPVSILFDNIRSVDMWHSRNKDVKYPANYKSLLVQAVTLQNPCEVKYHDISMTHGFDEIYKLMKDAHQLACDKHDKELGIC